MKSELVQAKLAEALATVPSGALSSAQRIVFEVLEGDMVRVSFEPSTPCCVS